MPHVAAVYTNVLVRPYSDVLASVPPATQITVELGSGPAAGDVVLLITSSVSNMLDPPAVSPPVNHELFTGPIEGFEPLIRYSTLATSPEQNAYKYGMGRTYVYRADGTEGAGTITIPWAWGTELEHPTIMRNKQVSQTVVVAYLRGLPDITGNIGWDLMPRMGQTWQGGGSLGPYLTDAWVDEVPDLNVWRQDLHASHTLGPGYKSDYTGGYEGMELYPGQVVVSYTLLSDAGELELAYEIPGGAWTTEAVLDLGVISPDETKHGSALLAWGEATLPRSRWKHGIASPEGADDTFGDVAYFLPFGYAPDTVQHTDGAVILRYVPTTGQAAGYHRSNAYQQATYPITAGPGDLALIIITDRYLPSLPAGWTTYKVQSWSGMSVRVAYKQLTDADLIAGGFDYILAGTGTGEWMIITYRAGTFLLGEPIRTWADSTDPNHASPMPWIETFAGEAGWHFGSAKFTPDEVGGDQVNATMVQGSGLGPTLPTVMMRRNIDPDYRTELVYTAWQKDCTQQVIWHKTSELVINAMYRASWVMNTPDSAIAWPPWSTTAQLLVAQYSAEPVTPGPDEFLLVNNPVLTAMASGSPEPFDVQFQVSTSATFGTLAWATTLEDVDSGTHGVTTGVALPKEADSYWRVRAGDGTSWGPWSEASRLRIRFGRTAGNEVMGLNIGIHDTPVGDAVEYQPLNVGLPDTVSPRGNEYMHLNVGFRVVYSRLGTDYMYESDVTDDVPVPHLWFAWLDHGFVNDHVWIYGQGLGTVATEYHAAMRVIDSNTDLEQSMSVWDWSVNPAGLEAYTDDRKIYPGTDGVDPFVNVEAVIVEVTIPSGIASPASVVDFFLARTDGGVSNKLPWLLYPLIPMPLGIAQGNTRSGGALRVVTGQPTMQQLEQLRAAFAPQAITALGGMLELPPETLVASRSTFTFGGGTSTANLEDPIDTPVPLSARWRPLTASIDARPDLGTGVSLWTPQSGSANVWRLVTGSEPYVDEAFAVMSRQDRIGRPAMIFPGDAWGELEEELPDLEGHPRFTFYMVAVVHPTTRSATSVTGTTATRSVTTTMLSTILDTGQPADTFPLALVLSGSTVSTRFGDTRNNFISLDIPGDYFSQRPVLIMFTTSKGVGRLSLLADKLYQAQGNHLAVAPHSRLYLGRDPEPDYGARMEILDVAVGAALTPAQEVALISALDGAYGVSGA